MIEITKDNKGAGIPVSAGSPVAKSSKVWGMVKRSNNKDKKTTL